MRPGRTRPLPVPATIRWGFVLFWTAALQAAEPAAPPNLIFILMDDMGYADVGPYGARDIRTPALDRLAREGVVLTDAYSNGPVCTPTRAAFVTGRYQQRVGLEWAILPAQKDAGLPPGVPSIAQALKTRGYATAIIGKWHLGAAAEFSPARHGFDESFAITGGNADMYSHQNITGETVLFANGRPVTSKSGYLTDLFNTRAVQFIEQPRARPFFLYLAYNAVHWPFQSPDRPTDVRTATTWYDGTRADYAAMLERVDHGIEQLLETLDRLGLAERTLVVFTNDNGGERLSDHGRLRDKKGTLWEGGIRVPAIARWTGRLPAGVKCSTPIITMDWTATFVAAAGARMSAPLDGINLLPVLKDPSRAADQRTLCWRKHREGIVQKAARRGRWKYVQNGAVEHLFDLSRDVGETLDLAAEEPGIVAELRDAVRAWEREIDSSPPPRRVL